MDFELTEEQRMFRTAYRLFVENEVAPLVEEAERDETCPVSLFPRMGDLGYLCVRYPQEYGGAGMDKVSESLAMEELGRVCVGIGSAIMMQSGVATSAIYFHGTEKQKQAYLATAAAGRKIACFGLTEPNAGSDAASIETKAVMKDGEYVINGTKMFISNAPIANFILTAAYTDRTKGARGGISLFVIDTDRPGVCVKKIHKMSLRSSETGEITFDAVRVPAEALVGQEGSGFGYLMESLADGRISHGARSLGLAAAAYQASVDYAKLRRQFGQPIGKFQAIAFKLARMSVNLEAARWLVYHAAWLHDHGQKCTKEASMAKLFASEMAQDVTCEAMQIHGGYGFMEDSPIQRYFRDARLGTVVEGTSEIQLQVLAKEAGLL